MMFNDPEGQKHWETEEEIPNIFCPSLLLRETSLNKGSSRTSKPGEKKEQWTNFLP